MSFAASARPLRRFLVCLILVLFPAALWAAERLVFTNGRELVCETREGADGGWMVGLPEGGTVFVPSSQLQRIDRVIAAPPELPSQPPESSVAPPCVDTDCGSRLSA